MPYDSKKQQAWAHTAAGTKALGGPAKVHEWDEATKKKKGGFAKLPERAHPANGQHDHVQHLATTSHYNGHGQMAGDHPTGSPCPAGDCPEDGGM